jgi:hypothetical protein
MFLPQGNFLVYSSWEGADQSLWIAKMSNAYTVGPSTLISRPTYAFVLPSRIPPPFLVLADSTLSFYSFSCPPISVGRQWVLE